MARHEHDWDFNDDPYTRTAISCRACPTKWKKGTPKPASSCWKVAAPSWDQIPYFSANPFPVEPLILGG
jgi:hypothetical protein